MFKEKLKTTVRAVQPAPQPPPRSARCGADLVLQDIVLQDICPPGYPNVSSEYEFPKAKEPPR
jgi:hypothetical protein